MLSLFESTSNGISRLPERERYLNTQFIFITKKYVGFIPSNEFVYGIVRNNKYIYIGQTKRGPIRFLQNSHIINQRYGGIQDTDIIHIWIANNYLNLERDLIRYYKPIYNKQIL